MADLGISLLFFNDVFYCRRCEAIASFKTCPHEAQHRLSMTGVEIKRMLKSGEMPPEELIRPEIAKVSLESLGLLSRSNSLMGDPTHGNPSAEKLEVSGE